MATPSLALASEAELIVELAWCGTIVTLAGRAAAPPSRADSPFYILCRGVSSHRAASQVLAAGPQACAARSKRLRAPVVLHGVREDFARTSNRFP
jgi:hypothetical protein